MSTEQEMDHVESCAEEEVDCSFEAKSPYRSVDGSCNNPLSPRWGSAGSRFSRMGPKSKQPTFTLRVRKSSKNGIIVKFGKINTRVYRYQNYQKFIIFHRSAYPVRMVKMSFVITHGLFYWL